MAPKKNWPTGYKEDYWYILRQTEAMRQIVDLVLDQGFGGIGSYPRIERLLPLLEMAARNIIIRCRSVDQRRAGERWPYWANTAMRMAEERGQQIAERVKSARRDLELHKMVLVERKITLCLLDFQEILAALRDGPQPEDSDEYKLSDIHEVVREFLEGGED